MDPIWYECEFEVTDAIVVYSFIITEYDRNGWVWCRMVYIHRQNIHGEVSNVEYSPTIHDGTGHYMGSPYRARFNSKIGRLKVHFGDGTVCIATDRRPEFYMTL